MESGNDVKTLRIYVSSTDKFRHAPVYEMIVYAAKRYGIVGATVIKGIMGYGSSSKISSAKFWEVSEKIPIIIEIIDVQEKITWFLETIKPFFDKLEKGCIITMEDSKVIMYKTGPLKTKHK